MKSLLLSFFSTAIVLFPQAIPNNPAYVPGPDAQVKAGVPTGRVVKFTWDKSRIFPGTSRAVSVYIPAQYNGLKPACLMIFQDGGGYASTTGGARTPIVLDNLIGEGAMPVTIAVFVDPGVTPATLVDQTPRYHRSLEYDGLGDKHARFLIEEIIPEVERRFDVKISPDPNDRGLAGGSSGGIASFVAAWERPDSFHRVISYIGSFANLRGGDTLSNMIRKVEPKPLRIFMQDGSNDQSIYGGSWFQANQSVAASLEYAGYDVKFVIGTEGHSGRHGNAILPEALRWLWRDYPSPIRASTGGPGARHYITDFLDPASDWQPVGTGYSMPAALAVDRDGGVFVADAKGGKIHKLSADGQQKVFRNNVASVGLMVGPDGTLYSAEPAAHRIMAYSPDGTARVAAANVNARDLTVSSKGAIYFTDPTAHQIWLMEAGRKPRMVFRSSAEENISFAAALRLTPDETLLDVSDRDGRFVWSFQIGPDGGLRYGMPFHRLDMDDNWLQAGGMTLDNTGHLYVATSMGIQISDPPGRVVGIIRKPDPGTPGSLVFGGAGLQSLYATSGGGVYVRKLRRTGVYPWQPVKLPRPQL